MSVLNGIVSLALISFLFAAIYKVLPDRLRLDHLRLIGQYFPSPLR
jgi:uncharacterized BrkB/YihY/UPF0761 family membrane protein